MKKLMILAVSATVAFGAISCKKSSTCQCSTTSTDAAVVRAAYVADSTFNAAQAALGDLKLTGDALDLACGAVSDGLIAATDSAATCGVK